MRLRRQGVVVPLLKYVAAGVLISLGLFLLPPRKVNDLWREWGEGQTEERSVVDLPPELEEWRNTNRSLWRDSEASGRIYANSGRRRMELQWKWVEDLRKSEYLKRAKKKRILITGGYDLTGEERKVKCHREGLNLGDKCEFVEDRWNIPTYVNYDSFDAVLKRRNWNYQFYEPRVPPGKLVFFDIQESPYTLHQGDFRVDNPLLVSYWRGSDILAPYYRWWPYSNTSNNTASKKKKKNYAEGKTKLVAMVASHCPTYNDRLGFVSELQKFIPVDVYGGCGPFSCDRKRGGCMERIQKEYKFYLAFENANCRDYITEKFFVNGLGGDILPVVLGAHPHDYGVAAPPHSFIHVEDFRSAGELAQFLLTLDRDEEKYNAYFEWKGSGEIRGGFGDALCRVCGLLFYADFFPPVQKWRDDAYSWLKVNPCLRPGEFYWRSGNYKYNYPGMKEIKD